MNTGSSPFQITAHTVAAIVSLLLVASALGKRYHMPEHLLYTATDLMVSSVALFFAGLGVFNLLQVWRHFRRVP